MRLRIPTAAAAALAAVALLAGCTSGATGALGPATLGPANPTSTAGTGSSSSSSTSSASLASLSPATGGVVGGTEITLTGKGLGKVDRVMIGTRPATGVKVVSATSVTAVAPSSVNYQAGTADVVAYAGSTRVGGTTPSYDWTVTSGVDREMSYAFQHWSGTTYNASYIDFNSVGGDCQNFVSQALDARGLAQNNSWYYNSTGHSETWGYAPAFDNYLKSTPSLGFTRLSADQRSELSVGDLAYFDWNDNDVPDHVMIVSSIKGSKISLVGHNLDFDYRDLDTAITVDHPGATVWFYKVPASL